MDWTRRGADRPPVVPAHAVRDTEAPPVTPEHETILRMQRLAGNRAVASTLAGDSVLGTAQRQDVLIPEVVIGVDLSPAQIAKARRFYTANRHRYTDKLIRDLQAAVGQPPSGVVDDATVIAVAKKQDEFGPPLVPDGMAGGRTLARLFPSGLARKDTTERFVADVKDVVAPSEWAALATPQARAERLVDLAAVQLASAEVGVAPEALAFDGKGLTAAAQHEQWRILLDIERNLLGEPSITDDQARQVAGTVLHEARHIEQFHRMARMLAAKGLSASAIARRMTIPAQVAADAHDNPLKAGTPEFITAEDQFEENFGQGKAQHDQVETESIRAEQALAAAKKAGDPTAIAKAQARREAARVNHDRLGTETDAVGTERAMSESW